MNAKKAFGMLILAITVLAFAGAAPASAETAASAVPAPAVAAPAQPGCGTGLELNLATPSQGEICPVAQPASAALDFLAPARFVRRTCVCSCGYPCTSDADCGGGVGSCRNGITCC
jgi:hypothetical protein